MKQAPVTFMIPDRVIGDISDFCISKNVKVSEFFRETVSEYAHDVKKIADAVATKVLCSVSSDSEPQNLRRVTHRIEAEDTAQLRKVARNSDMSFEGLMRIIAEDKIKRVYH